MLTPSVANVNSEAVSKFIYFFIIIFIIFYFYNYITYSSSLMLTETTVKSSLNVLKVKNPCGAYRYPEVFRYKSSDKQMFVDSGVPDVICFKPIYARKGQFYQLPTLYYEIC